MKSSSLVSIVFCAYTKMFSANDLQHELIYCLAFVKSAELNIIGRKSSLQAMLVGRSIYHVFHGMCIKEKPFLCSAHGNCMRLLYGKWKLS